MISVLVAVLLEPGDAAPLIGMTIIAVTVIAILILRPLVVAFSKRELARVDDRGVSDRVRELESRVRELEEVAHRTAELEERVDFAERMLAQAREPQQLPGE